MQHEGVMVVDQDTTTVDAVAAAAVVLLSAKMVSLVELLQEKRET
jgi:hypothetical protein